MAFLSSLLYTGTRFAGQRERMKQFFEAGVSAFPRDYPSVAAYDDVANECAEQERARWERTPPAKKPNYEKLGTRSPWLADWGVVLGLEKPTATQTSRGGQGEEELVATQREHLPDPDATEIERERSQIRPWLLRGPRVPKLLSNAFITPAQFLGEMNKLREKNNMAPLDASLSADDLMRSALVMVRMKMVRRGAPTDMAHIYAMQDLEARDWIKGLNQSPRNADSSEPKGHEVWYPSLVYVEPSLSYCGVCVPFLAWRDQASPGRHHRLCDDGRRVTVSRRRLCDGCDSCRAVLCAAQTGFEVCTRS